MPPVISFEDRRKIEGLIVKGLLALDGELKIRTPGRLLAFERLSLLLTKGWWYDLGGMSEEISESRCQRC